MPYGTAFVSKEPGASRHSKSKVRMDHACRASMEELTAQNGNSFLAIAATRLLHMRGAVRNSFQTDIYQDSRSGTKRPINQR